MTEASPTPADGRHDGMGDPQPPAARRPLATRSARWAQVLAAALARRRVRPDAISVASVVFAMAAAAALLALPAAAGWQLPALLVATAAGIQLRLLSNMLDGMVAVEGGLRSPVGPLYNEVPDRIADTLILVAAGYALPGLPCSVGLGWTAAALAMLTAYIRALGGELGAPGCFHGPMAKPHRMATLTGAVLVAACLSPWPWWPWILWSALATIVLGAAITSLRRLCAIAAVLRGRT